MPEAAAPTITVSLGEPLVEDLARLVSEAVLARQRPAETGGWLSVKSAAEYLDTSPAAIRSLVKRGELSVHKTPNGRLLFDRAELDAWVRGEATPPAN